MKSYFLIYLRGIAMGAADIVPGVSGGTIAFISGIYGRFMSGLDGITIKKIIKLISKPSKTTWNALDGNFLVALFLGIGTSVFTLSGILTYLLDEHPIPLWSFFFGLILASAIIIGRKLAWKKPYTYVALIIGAVIAFIVTVGEPLDVEASVWTVMPAGFIAICAMLLPGISGSFILLLLNHYRFVMDAYASKNLTAIVFFLAGCTLGLITFSKVIKFLYAKIPNIITALLTGFMIGALGKVWPWKEVLEYRIDSHGKQVPFIDEPTSPDQFSGDPQYLAVILCSVFGLALVLGIEAIANKVNKKNAVK